MRLVAVYIAENTLPYIFGSNHLGKTLNFGGKYKYEILAKDKILILNQIEENDSFIRNFYGEDIVNISAIVGKNGIGKTTILRSINHSFDNKSIKSLYIFNDENDKIFIKNELDFFTLETKLDYEHIQYLNFDINKMYYSPVLDYELLETKTSLALASSSNESLYSIYLEQLTKSILLLNDNIIEEVKKVYPDFPHYENVNIRISKLKKGYFQDTYARANLGNKERADVAKIYIESDLDELKSNDEIYDIQKSKVVKDLERYINLIKSKSFNALFDDLWNLEKYKTEYSNDFIHNGTDFLKDFEITILSYLLLGGTFPDSPFQGSYDFSNIISAKNFNERLDELLSLFIANSNKYVFEEIIRQNKKVRIDDLETLDKIINKENISNYSIGGFESSNSIKLLRKHLNTFVEVKSFYEYLKLLVNENKFTLKDGEIKFDFKKHNSDEFVKLTDKYKSLIESLNDLPVNVVIFDFKPEKILSSGEKSILNFFATIYNQIDFISHREHHKVPYYLLLLDEPELGYHPIWKKKFIQSITKILPVLFKKISIEDKDSQQYICPKIQIIFTTHDPLTLSDIPHSNILYLEYDEILKTCIIVDSSVYRKKSFAGNISDLLSDSFFLNNGLIGDFAKEKIQYTIDWILEQRIKKGESNTNFVVNQQEYNYHEKLIKTIDENIIRIKLAEMLEELIDEKKLQQELLTREIEYLNKKKNDLSRPK